MLNNAEMLKCYKIYNNKWITPAQTLFKLQDLLLKLENMLLNLQNLLLKRLLNAVKTADKTA